MRETHHSDAASGAGGIGAIFTALLGGVARNVDDVARGVMHCGDDVARVSVQGADDFAWRGFSVADDLAARPVAGSFHVESHLARLQATPARHATEINVHIDSCSGHAVAQGIRGAVDVDDDE